MPFPFNFFHGYTNKYITIYKNNMMLSIVIYYNNISLKYMIMWVDNYKKVC